MLDPESRRQAPAEFTRRSVLAGGMRGLLAVSALGVLSGVTVTACGSDTAPEPDPLEAQLQSARADADLAAAAAKAAPAAVAPALLVIADQRGRHATALIEELARAAGEPTPSAEPPPATVAPKPATPPPPVREVVSALRRSADSAAALAPTLSGYRAGLMGSIAAACTAFYTVGLPDKPEEKSKDQQARTEAPR